MLLTQSLSYSSLSEFSTLKKLSLTPVTASCSRFLLQFVFLGIYLWVMAFILFYSGPQEKLRIPPCHVPQPRIINAQLFSRIWVWCWGQRDGCDTGGAALLPAPYVPWASSPFLHDAERREVQGDVWSECGNVLPHTLAFICQSWASHREQLLPQMPRDWQLRS